LSRSGASTIEPAAQATVKGAGSGVEQRHTTWSQRRAMGSKLRITAKLHSPRRLPAPSHHSCVPFANPQRDIQTPCGTGATSCEKKLVLPRDSSFSFGGWSSTSQERSHKKERSRASRAPAISTRRRLGSLFQTKLPPLDATDGHAAGETGGMPRGSMPRGTPAIGTAAPSATNGAEVGAAKILGPSAGVGAAKEGLGDPSATSVASKAIRSSGG
jgi:hypothetical protein